MKTDQTISFCNKHIDIVYHPFLRTIGGFVGGILFILLTKKILGNSEGLDIFDIGDSNSQKIVLIVFVMTLHSLSEGIGIGVSFGGSSGMKLGQLISLSLAVHNIPEGLAVGLVLTSRKVNKLQAGTILTQYPLLFILLLLI